MHDWFVSVLISVREMAAESGLVALAEEMDVAILVAANESHAQEMTGLEVANEPSAGRDTGKAVQHAGDVGARHYH